MSRSGRPVVGITPDVGNTVASAGRPSVPRYQLKQAYADAVLAAGGLPIVLPFSEDETAPAEAIALCDALVLTGGAFDIPPEAYGARRHRRLGELKPQRTHYEQRLLRAALAADLPVLGVCGGMQLLAVEAGATLWQDLRDELPTAFDHEQKQDPREPAHPVAVTPGSLLHQLTGQVSLQVNSTHHQAVRELGRCVVSGLSPDGVIEAIELPGRFALGVQWHPELLAAPEHLALYRALVREAARRR